MDKPLFRLILGISTFNLALSLPTTTWNTITEDTTFSWFFEETSTPEPTTESYSTTQQALTSLSLNKSEDNEISNEQTSVSSNSYDLLCPQMSITTEPDINTSELEKLTDLDSDEEFFPAFTPLNWGYASGSGSDIILTLINNNGTPCVKMNPHFRMMVFFYNIEHIGNETMTAAIFPTIPNSANDITVEGNCESVYDGFIRVSWSGYIMNWYFAKKIDAQKWYLMKIELLITGNTEWFHRYGICVPTERPFIFSLTSELFTTPLEYSFVPCRQSTIYSIHPEENYNSDKTNIKAFFFMEPKFKFEPFLNKHEFNAPVPCNIKHN